MAKLRLLAATAVFSLAATAAFAAECGGDGPICPGGPTPPRVLTRPAAVITYGSATSHAEDMNRYTPIADGVHFIDGSGYVVGAGQAFAPDLPAGSVITTAGSASVRSELSPAAAVFAHAANSGGQRGGLGQVGLIYSVVVHAADADAAALLQSRLFTNGAIATATGKLSVSAVGQAYSTAQVTTGDGIFNYSYDFADDLYGLPTFSPALLKRVSYGCDPTGFYLSGGFGDGCGAHDFTLGVNFVRADAYQGGSTLDFIGNISLLAGAQATGFSELAGIADSFADPIVTLSSELDPHLYTLTVGGGRVANGAPLTGGVPEPASWALMIAGFGLSGAALRRRRSAEA